MKAYTHIKSNYKAIKKDNEEGKTGWYYIANTDSWLPDNMIENTNDWKLDDITLNEMLKNFPVLSYNDVMKMSSQNGHYRDFTTAELDRAVRQKIVLEDSFNLVVAKTH